MGRRVFVLTLLVLLMCRAALGERWLIERAPDAGLAAADRWQLAAAEVLLRYRLAQLRGVTLLSKSDVASDVATLGLERLSSATGEVRVKLGKFARASGLIELAAPVGRGGQVGLRAIDLTRADREKSWRVAVKLDDADDINVRMHMLAIESARLLHRVPSEDEVVRMKRRTQLSLDALVALAKGTDARTDAERELLFKQATMLAPEAALVWYLQARQLHATGQNLEAISAYRRAIRLDGEQTSYHYDLANAFFDERRYAEAATEYERAISLDPSHAPSHENLIRVRKRQGLKPDAVLAKYRELTSARLETPVVHLQVGRLLVGMKKLPEAIAAFREAVKLDASDPIGQFNLAHALEQAHKEAEAIAEYKRAVELAPNYAKAHNNLAFLYEKNGKETLALFHYQRAVKFAPDYALAWNNLGILYGKRGKHRLEVEAFRRQVKLTPKDPVAHFNLGVAYHRTREYKLAIASYKKSLELKPDDKLTHWHLAHAYERAGIWNLANDHWRKVLSLNPTPEEKTTAERHIRENTAR